MSDPFDQWAIVELMGHRRLAGQVTEQEIAGQAFIRLDIHATADETVTQFYSPSAVYCITPTSEETARRAGALSRPAPVSRWELEPRKPHLVTDDLPDGDGFYEPASDDDEDVL